jgi:predicted nucleic acid-binding Zn ribbon protein
VSPEAGNKSCTPEGVCAAAGSGTKDFMTHVGVVGGGSGFWHCDDKVKKDPRVPGNTRIGHPQKKWWPKP